MKRLIPLLLIATITFWACNDDDDIDLMTSVNREFYSLMQDYYYWYEQIPDLNPDLYSNPYQLMEAIRCSPPDKWSYVTTRTELEAYYNQASYVGFGFASGFNSSGELIISLVYNSSPLKQDGINRGWQIVSIDGQTPTSSNFNSLIGDDVVGVTKTFVFKSQNDSTATHTYTKEQIATNTVFADTVYSFGPTKVGYFMLKSFINPTAGELTNTFAKFQSSSINELVVDLRYNGGGLISVASQLANLIGANSANSGVFGTYSHNNKHTEMNENIYFETLTNSISLNRVFFITTSSSASASELVINGLKPYVDVVLVGSKTHGKPVGMYQFTFNDPSVDWAFVPICFSIFNANGEGDYFDGLQVNISADDDVKHAFGDTEEECLNAALSEIGVITKHKCDKSHNQFEPIVQNGLKGEIGSF